LAFDSVRASVITNNCCEERKNLIDKQKTRKNEYV
jgi:hypothetical protein